MHKVTFSDINKSLLKNKALKSKKGHSLLEAEALFKEAKRNVDTVATLTITLTDLENSKDYIFDKIVVNETVPGLMKILDDEITSSGHESAHKLVNGIVKSYQMEKDSLTKRSGKKSKGLLSRIKRNKDSEIDHSETNEDTGVDGNTDFKELEGNNTIETEFVNLPNSQGESAEDVFSEVHASNNYVSEPPVLDDQSDEFKEPVEPEEDQPMSNEDDEQVSLPFGLEEEPEAIEIDDDFSRDDEEKSIDTKEEKQVAKHERVVFPSYNSYLDISAVDVTVKRFKERFEKEHLVKFLGLKTLSSDAITDELNAVKVNYAFNALDESEFVLLRDYFHNSIETIKDKTQTQLTQVYEKAMLLDYEEEASKFLENDLSSLLEESEKEYKQYEVGQLDEYKVKLEKFDYEQEKALEDFKRQQDLDRSMFVKDLDAKKSNRLSLYKDNVQDKLVVKKIELVDNKMYDLKYQSVNELAETKRVIVRNFEEQLDSAMDDVWDNLQDALGKLEKEIESHIPNWKVEINEKRKLEAEQREELRQQEALELEKQRIELQRHQLEKTAAEDKKENETIAVINKKLESYDEKFNNILNNNMNFHPYNQGVPQQQMESKTDNDKSGNNPNKIIISGIAAFILLGGGVFFGKSLVEADVDSTNIEATKYEQLVSSISSLEEKFKLSEVPEKEDKQDLASLLDEKDYAKAISLFKDAESLRIIETELYENEDLTTLVTFNKTNDTTFGKLDEAILSKDDEKVLKIYKDMSDDSKEQLTKDRKAEIALYLYQDGEEKAANKLLGVKKDK